MPDDPLIGFRTDTLQFDALLGRGAMSAVYRGRQVRLDRPVTIKVIASHLAENPDFLDRFNREAKSLARLLHPHVVACHDFGPSPGPDGRPLLLLVMEFIDGTSLAEKSRSETLTVRTVLDLYRQAAEGLAAAHALGIVHRDVKPDNIMVTYAGVAKLTDFGLLKADDDADLTEDGTVMGTPAYMAPEVCKGQPLTSTSDLYSLGCSLFHSLTGETPYRSATSLEAIQKHISAPVPQLRERAPGLARLDGLMSRALAKDPAARFPDAQALARELFQWIERVPASALTGEAAKQPNHLDDLPSGRPEPLSSSGDLGRSFPPAEDLEPLPMKQERPSARAPTETELAPPSRAATPLPPPAGSPRSTAPLPFPLPAAPAAPTAPPAATPAATPAPPATAPDGAAPAAPVAIRSTAALPFPLPPGYLAPKVATKPRPSPAEEKPAPPEAKAADSQKAGTEARRRPSTTTINPEELARRQSQLHATVGKMRQNEYQEHEADGDRHVAAGRWEAAALAYQNALRTAPPAYSKRYAEKVRLAITHQEGRPPRPPLIRLALGLIAIVAVVVALWLWLPRLQKTAAPPRSPAPTASRPPLKLAIESLESRAANETVEWTTVADEANQLLALAGDQRPRVQAVLDRAHEQLARMKADLAAIEAAWKPDPRQALALAERFRVNHRRAGRLLERLPLPARLELHGVDTAVLAVTVDDVPLPAAAGLVFCRRRDAPTRVAVTGAGYRAVALTVPPDPDPAEEVLAVTMRESPVWILPGDGRPAWMSLSLQGALVVVAGPHALRAVVVENGVVLSQLDRVVDAGGQTPEFRWLPLPGPPGQHRFGTSAAQVVEVPVGERGFGPARIIHTGRNPIVAFGEGELVFRMNQRARFAVEVGPEPSLVADAPDQRLWQHALSGVQAPWLQLHDELLVAVDDLALHVFDQEGKELDLVNLPSGRIGPVAAFDGGHLLVLPLATGLDVLRADQKYRFAVQPPVAALAGLIGTSLSTRDDLLLALGDDHRLRLVRLREGAFQEVWAVGLPPQRRFASRTALTGAYACCHDPGTLLIFDLANHELVRTLALEQSLIAPPVVVGGRVIVAEDSGEVLAFPLKAPGAAGSPKK